MSDFLEGLVGGMVGAAMVPVVTNLLNQHGGVQGIISQFQNKGYGSTVNSWVTQGPSAPVRPNIMTHVFGEETINQLAAENGMTPGEMQAKLAQVLPHAVNHLTPDGVVPPVAPPKP